jgi:hypothetical protein
LTSRRIVGSALGRPGHGYDSRASGARSAAAIKLNDQLEGKVGGATDEEADHVVMAVATIRELP